MFFCLGFTIPRFQVEMILSTEFGMSCEVYNRTSWSLGLAFDVGFYRNS